MPFVLAFVVPKTDVPETDAPETDAPETDVPETDVPETDVPERDGELLFFFNIVESFSGSYCLNIFDEINGVCVCVYVCVCLCVCVCGRVVVNWCVWRSAWQKEHVLW